jgi:transcription antitermination factor NusG
MPPAVFHVGESVRIIDGPFVTFIGVVRAIATAPAGEIVTVGVGLKGRKVPVKLAVSRVERLR